MSMPCTSDIVETNEDDTVVDDGPPQMLLYQAPPVDRQHQRQNALVPPGNVRAIQFAQVQSRNDGVEGTSSGVIIPPEIPQTTSSTAFDSSSRHIISILQAAIQLCHDDDHSHRFLTLSGLRPLYPPSNVKNESRDYDPQ